jgi:hypothetical protein
LLWCLPNAVHVPLIRLQLATNLNGANLSPEVPVLKSNPRSNRPTLIALAALLAATFAVGVLDSAQASTTPGDKDLFFRRFRGADEVDGRGGGSGSSGSGSSGGGGQSSGSGSGGSGSGSSGGGNSSGGNDSSGGGSSSGSGKGGSSGDDHNSNDDDDRFKK